MDRWLTWVHLLVILAPISEAFCPQGFGPQGSFPSDWNIPAWPQDMSLDVAADLKTVGLGGFQNALLNEEYLQGPGTDFEMQGRETYWQASGKYFMYYCQRFQKWRIAEISAFGKNMDGNCFAFVTDAHPGRDILNTSLLKGWAEVQNGEWVLLDDAGVFKVGKLGDQLEADDDDVEEDIEVPEGCENDTEDGDSPFGEKKDKSNCPVMPHVRKARDKVVKAAHAAGAWVRRLFPKYLGSPDEEDAIPADNPLFPEQAAGATGQGECNIENKAGCSFKEQFFIDKQQNKTFDEKAAEFNRLAKMQDLVMKPEQKDWLQSRLSILGQLLTKAQAEEKKNAEL